MLRQPAVERLAESEALLVQASAQVHLWVATSIEDPVASSGTIRQLVTALSIVMETAQAAAAPSCEDIQTGSGHHYVSVVGARLQRGAVATWWGCRILHGRC